MPVQEGRSADFRTKSRWAKAWSGMARWFKYKYLQLSRAKGGAAKVAAGFSIGLAVEMFTLPTFGLAFFLIFPLVYLFRASLAGALIGFVFGKIIYIPVAFLNAKVGGFLLPDHLGNWITLLPHWLSKMIYMNAKLIVGGMVNGTAMALLLYFPLKQLLGLFTARRSEKRRLRREQLVLKANDSMNRP